MNLFDWRDAKGSGGKHYYENNIHQNVEVLLTL